MSIAKILLIFTLAIVTIAAQRDKKKPCVHNLVNNGTNLLTAHRKQLLVIGVVNFNNQTFRTQASRFSDLQRELERMHIRDSVARIFLINERDAAQFYSGPKYGRIGLVQDNARDRLVSKLRQHAATGDNFVFGRCGYMIYSQEHPHSNLENVKNYQDLLRVITTAVKNKRGCVNLCS